MLAHGSRMARAWRVAILGIIVPCVASAATTARLETRVMDFELVVPTLIGRSTARTAEKHRPKIKVTPHLNDSDEVRLDVDEMIRDVQSTPDKGDTFGRLSYLERTAAAPGSAGPAERRRPVEARLPGGGASAPAKPTFIER